MSRGRGLGDKTFLTFLIYESELGVKITFKRQKGETFVADLAYFPSDFKSDLPHDPV